MALAILKRGTAVSRTATPRTGQPYFVSVGLLTPLVLNPCDLLICLFLILGEEFIPQLQCVLYPYYASVHEAGLRQDAH